MMRNLLCVGVLLGVVGLFQSAVGQTTSSTDLMSELEEIENQQNALATRQQEILDSLKAEEEALKSKLISIQGKITNFEQKQDNANLIRLSTELSPSKPSPSIGSPPKLQTVTENGDDAPREADDEAENESEAGSQSGKTEESTDIKGWFLGAGLGTRFNLSGDRVEDISFAELEDGSLIAQIRKSDEAEIRVLFETHYIFDNPSALTNGLAKRVEALASCGLWAFIAESKNNGKYRGCGPFVAVALDKDASPEEFALGHMLSLKRQGAKRPFNLGYGIIIDPDSKTIDRDLFVDGTNQVKAEYISNVKDGTLSLTTQEETIGFLLLFSTNF